MTALTGVLTKATFLLLQNMRRGLTLAELLISVLLLTITFVGGMAFYLYSNRHLQTALHRKIATEIANSAMEQMKNTGYNSLPNPAAGIELCGATVPVGIRYLTGNRKECVYGVDDNGDGAVDYKRVTVEIDWQDPGKASQQIVRLDSYIVP